MTTSFHILTNPSPFLIFYQLYYTVCTFCNGYCVIATFRHLTRCIGYKRRKTTMMMTTSLKPKMYVNIFKHFLMTLGTHGSILGWGTMLQAGRSPVRVPYEVDFFNLHNLSSHTMALGSTQPLTKMSTRNLPGGKKWPACRADNIAAIYEMKVWKCGSLNLSQP
jgi:hypothetical protein